MGRAKIHEKRRHIAEAAIKIFARKGYHGSRISDIAREAGISYGLVYHYFKSKEELVTYLFRSKWELLLQVIGTVGRDRVELRDQVATISGFLVEAYRMNPELVEAMVMEITRNSKFVRGKNLKLLDMAISGLEEIIRRAQERGEVAGGVHPKVAAYCFFGAVEAVLTGFVFRSFDGGDSSLDDVKEAITSIFCNGILSPARSSPGEAAPAAAA